MLAKETFNSEHKKKERERKHDSRRRCERNPEHQAECRESGAH